MTHHKMSNKTINLINQTHLTITKQNIVSPTQSILITISGGQDSLCLFFILLHLKKQWKWYFGLLYCNHFWQIDSFYINSLIFKLGFFFLIPSYLSLPSENIFSEQKSRTWRYGQFNRLGAFYKYDIIFTGHTSTDKIETVLLQLFRGTGTRGLSTLNWIRPISKYKSMAFPLNPKKLLKVSSSLHVLTQTKKPVTILNNKNVLFPHTSFQIQFCNLFFLSAQMNRLENSFFAKTKLSLYEKVEEFVGQLFAERKNQLLAEKQNVLNNKQSGSQRLLDNFSLSLPALVPTLVVGIQNIRIKEQVNTASPCPLAVTGRATDNRQGIQPSVVNLTTNAVSNLGNGCDYTKNLRTKLFFIKKTKSPIQVSKVTRLAFQPNFINISFQSQSSWDNTFYGKNTGRNTVALQGNREKISYRHTNWIYDDFLFLTLDKTPIIIPFDKLRHFCRKQDWLFPVSDNVRNPIFHKNKDLFRQNILKRGITFDAQFIRRTLFPISRRITFKDESGTRPASALAFAPGKGLTPEVFPARENWITNKVRYVEQGYQTKFDSQGVGKRSIASFSYQGVNKIKPFFYLTSSDRLKFSVKRKFKHSNISRKSKRSFFAFNTLILNQKPSKVLIKYFTISCWAPFKRNFLELQAVQLKDVLNLEITPFLIRSYLGLSNYKQIAIILVIYPLATFSFFRKSFYAQTTFDNLTTSERGNDPDKQNVKYIPLAPLPSPAGQRVTHRATGQLNLNLKILSYQTDIRTKNLILFRNTNRKLKSIFPQVIFTPAKGLTPQVFPARENWITNKVRYLEQGYQTKFYHQGTRDHLNKKKQRHNWDRSYFCQARIKKENDLNKTQNNVNLGQTFNLGATTQFKIVVYCDHLYLKEKTKKLLDRKCLLMNRPISKIKDHRIFTSTQNNYDLSTQSDKEVQFIFPSQKGFIWREKDTRQCFVVRPFLFVTRFDLKKVCAFWQLPVYPDQTNEKLVYFRNRIRKQLLPVLRFFFNPQIDKLFLQFAEIATTEQLYLDELAIYLQDKFEIKKINTFELNISVFNFIPIAIQRRLLRQFLNQYFTKQIKFFHIKTLLNILAKKKKSRFVKYHKSLLSRKNYKVGYQMFPNVISQNFLSTLSITEKGLLDKSEFPNLKAKKTSEFLQHFIFALAVTGRATVRQGFSKKPKLRRNLINLDEKLRVRNIFLNKNKLETPQILFFAGVGTCFMTSRRLILVSNSKII